MAFSLLLPLSVVGCPDDGRYNKAVQTPPWQKTDSLAQLDKFLVSVALRVPTKFREKITLCLICLPGDNMNFPCGFVDREYIFSLGLQQHRQVDRFLD